MRVRVEVTRSGGDYEVDVRLDALEEPHLHQHVMRRLDGEVPVAPADPASFEIKPEQLDALMDRLGKSAPEKGDVELIGRYLFESLLGDQAWQLVVEAAKERDEHEVELALWWDSSELDLHRLGWEAMHDGDGFLGSHDELTVAITRVVGDAEGVPCPRPVQAPARVLIAVGAPLRRPEIRPGAEVIGLLRGIERRGAAIDSKIVDAVTLSELADACARFKPQVVHIVSHGRLEEGRGELQLTVEEEGESGWVNGEKLLQALLSGESRPSLVLITGCHSAAAGEHMDSLAVELVKGGIPMAIGMAGKISDPVCRLFTRGFGISLSEGDRLVEAMANGRRAGLQRQREGVADDPAWTLPSVYLAPTVPAGHTPVEVAEDSGILACINRYPLRRDPVFYGRRDLGKQFDDLIRQGGPEVLVAYAENKGKFGKTRLQHEFAGRALRRGHVVVMIDDDGGDPSRLPHASVQLGAALLKAIVETRERFGLPKLFESRLLEHLGNAIGTHPNLSHTGERDRLSSLHEFLGNCFRAKVPDDALADVIGSALLADLDVLMQDVRSLEDEWIGPESRVVMILGGIESWGSAAGLLLERMIGRHGLGDANMPVPVFATCWFAEVARPTLEAARDRANGRPWEQWVELKPFGEHEDTLAYQWVLLHPWSPLPYGDQVYAPNPERGDEWQEAFTNHLEGLPGDFEDPRFYLIANVLLVSKAFVGANDDRILEEYASSRS